MPKGSKVQGQGPRVLASQSSQSSKSVSQTHANTLKHTNTSPALRSFLVLRRLSLPCRVECEMHALPIPSLFSTLRLYVQYMLTPTTKW